MATSSSAPFSQPRRRRGRSRWLAVAGTALLLVSACEYGSPDANGSAAEDGEASPTLSVDSTWQWQLQGAVDTSYDVDVYDIDLFEPPQSVIDGLHAEGRIVICYFSAGSYEKWRPDSVDYGKADLGLPIEGFEDELWLDMRSPTVRSVIEGRLDLAVERGCDGVEPDNVDGATNDTGFDLTAADVVDFNRFIAAQSHQRDLLVGLKNTGTLVPDLVDEFDFVVNEQCHEYDECSQFTPFLDQGKPVFNAEYQQHFVDDHDALCVEARDASIRTLVLPLLLDDEFRITCD